MLKKIRIQNQKRKKRGSKLDPYREKKRAIIEKHNFLGIRALEETRKMGDNCGYTILKEYCNDIRKDVRTQTVYRYETDHRKKSQVDFGKFGYIDMDGKRRKLYAFYIVLGYSRTRYAELTTDMSTENVMILHKY